MSWWSDAVVRFHYRLANVAVRLGRHEAAADALGKVLRTTPEDQQAEFHRAWNLLEVPERRDEAIACFQRILRSRPSAAGFYLLGCGLQHQRRYAEAVDAYQESLRIEDPEISDVHYNLGCCLAELSRWHEAADAFQHAVDRAPTDAEMWRALGSALNTIGRWEESIRCLRRAFKLDPGALHAVELAKPLYELHQLDEAEQVLVETLQADPANSALNWMLSVVLMGQDRYDEALEAVEAASAIDPEPMYRATAAVILADAGRTDDAHREIRTVLERVPGYREAYGALGFVQLKMKEGAAALETFERALEQLGPEAEKLPSSLWVGWMIQRGDALSLLGRHEEAMASFSEALRYDPTFFERWPESSAEYQTSRAALSKPS